jgi:hypothetical protein
MHCYKVYGAHTFAFLITMGQGACFGLHCNISIHAAGGLAKWHSSAVCRDSNASTSVLFSTRQHFRAPVTKKVVAVMIWWLEA